MQQQQQHAYILLDIDVSYRQDYIKELAKLLLAINDGKNTEAMRQLEDYVLSVVRKSFHPYMLQKIVFTLRQGIKMLGLRSSQGLYMASSPQFAV